MHSVALIKVIIALFCVLQPFKAEGSNENQIPKDPPSQAVADVVAKRTNVFTCPRTVESSSNPITKCTTHEDCYHSVDELCCQHPTTNVHQCMKGIVKAEKEGDCPQPSMWNDYCIADDPGCLYDSECSGTDKCCPTFCEVKSCLEVRQNIDCPLSLTPGGANCTTNDDCTFEEVCCRFDDDSYKCNTGVSMLYKPGYCPYQVEGVNCRTDVPEYFEGDCFFDHECPGDEKCCHSTCNYYQCANLTAPANYGGWKRAINPAKREMMDLNADSTIGNSVAKKEEDETNNGDADDLISLLVRKLKTMN